jgi:hypothetical protein
MGYTFARVGAAVDMKVEGLLHSEKARMGQAFGTKMEIPA